MLNPYRTLHSLVCAVTLNGMQGICACGGIAEVRNMTGNVPSYGKSHFPWLGDESMHAAFCYPLNGYDVLVTHFIFGSRDAALLAPFSFTSLQLVLITVRLSFEF